MSQKIAAFFRLSMHQHFLCHESVVSMSAWSKYSSEPISRKTPVFCLLLPTTKSQAVQPTMLFFATNSATGLGEQAQPTREPCVRKSQATHRECSGIFDFFLTLRSQHLQMKSDIYRQVMRRKVRARHRHVQLSCTAQGLLQQPTHALFSG